LDFRVRPQVKKPEIHIRKSAADYSDEAFFKEVWRLKGHRVEPNRSAERRGSKRIKPAWRECVRSQDASTVLGESLRARIVEIQGRLRISLTPLPCSQKRPELLRGMRIALHFIEKAML
jgi:hypothetical protein